MRSLKLLVVVCLLTSLASLPLLAQNSGATGTVYDKTGAVVPKASIELKDAGTNATLTATSNDVGQFTFVNVPAGIYKMTVTAQGFRKYVVPNLKIDIAQTATVNPVLEIGAVSQVVEVQAGAGTALQTQDAAMGNVMDRKMLDSIPTLSRDATAMLLLQPMATPGFNQNPLAGVNGEGDNTGGQVAGARSDQNTFMVDGGDATDSTAGSGQYAGTNFTATPRAVVPTPVESLEEFRVVTNNPSASFGRSEGGVVEMETKHGTNDWHGAGYDYLENDKFNANSWNRNLQGNDLTTGKARSPRARLRDNRFGGRFGGPIWKDKTFFFVHYEGRRYYQGLDIQRLVPSEAMKLGILHYIDTSGNVQAVNLNNATSAAVMDPGIPTGSGCLPFTPSAVPLGGTNVDPRGLGFNAVVKGVWAFEPTGHDCSRGDKLNTVGFSSTAPFNIREDFAVVRLDHKITQNWQVMSSFRFDATNANQNNQMDIGGLLPGDVKGSPKLTAVEHLQPRYMVLGVTGAIGAHWTSDFHFNYLRHYWEWIRVHPFAQVPGTTHALSIGSSGDSVSSQLIPMNVNVQDARARMWNGKDFNFSENMSWIKGSHLVTFGGRAESQRFTHRRDDKVLVATVYPFDTVGKLSTGSGEALWSTTRFLNGGPPRSSPSGSTFRRYIASVLGMVDRSAEVATRAPDLTPNPLQTPLLQHTVVDSYQLYMADTWKVKPSLTLTFGVNWGIQMPPYESNGSQTMMVNDATGKLIIGDEYLAARKAAALAGTVFNPQLDLVPIKKTGRKYPYNPDWSNFGPRVAAAWNPSFTNGLLGSVLGDRKTVIRTGYARTYDRINGVGIVMIPALGAGFSSLLTCTGPNTAGVCTGGGTNPTTAFRIGPAGVGDGTTVPLPVLSNVTAAGKLIPGVNAPTERLDFRIDPHRKVGYSDGVDLSVQRELPGNLLLEVGVVSKWSKKLYQGYALNHVPYMTTAGGQSFQQAFSHVANAARACNVAGGGSASAACLGLIPNQPFFESALGGVASNYCTGNASCTQAAIANEGSQSFAEANVYDVWHDFGLSGSGVFTGNGGGADSTPGAFGPQITDAYWIGSGGHSNYNAGFLSLRSRGWKGLTFDFNYTFSHAFDQIGQNQESLNETTDAFNLDRDYGSAQFDRRHTITTLVSYDLPFGKGKMFSAGNWVDNFIGGWGISSIYSYGSGLPVDIVNFDSCEEYGADDLFGNCSAYIPASGPKFLHMSPRSNATVSGLFNASSGSTCGNAGNNGFANPDAVCANFRTPDILLDGRTGRGFVREFTRWNVDFGVSKTTKLTERVSMRFDAQFSNIFNHPLKESSVNGFTQYTDIVGALGSFGNVGLQYNVPRFIQLGLRFDF